MKMNLQLFSEDVAEQPATESAEPIGSEEEVPSNDPDNGDVDPGNDEQAKEIEADKVVEKLQKRLSSKTRAEKEALAQLEEAKARVRELEEKMNQPPQEVEPDPVELAQQAKDEEINQLKQQIKRAEAIQLADSVLKESDIAASKDILAMVVSDNDDQTASNVKALVGLLNEQQRKYEVKRNTGRTPKLTKKTTPKNYDLSKMTYQEITQLRKTQPSVYRELTKNYTN